MNPQQPPEDQQPCLNLFVLPNLSAGEGGLRQNRLPFIYIERQGIWQDASGRDTLDLSALRKQTALNLRTLMGRVEREPAAEINLAFKTICRQLYHHLVPRRLDEALQALVEDSTGREPPPALCIHSPIEWIPWEILHDGVDYLGLRFQVARLPIAATGPNLPASRTLIVERIYNLLGREVLDPALNTDWEQTFHTRQEAPNKAVEIRYPDAAAGNGYPSLATLEMMQRPGILHFTCHGGFEAQDGAVFWSLDERATIPEEYRLRREIVEMLGELVNFRAANTLVFGNACTSLEAVGGHTPDGGLTPGFGTTFFAQGAAAFVGTFAPVTQRTAVHFARQFYTHLLHGEQTVGAALWQARRTFANQPVHDPSHLFYCLYGLPGTRFKLAWEEPRARLTG
jgi:hypothetical protein